MKVIHKRPVENFYDIDMEAVRKAQEAEKSKEQDEFKFFVKTHTPNEVGINTSGLNCKDLNDIFFAKLTGELEGKPFHKWMEMTTYATGERYDIIEGDLKSSRKDDVTKANTAGWNLTLIPPLKPLMTSSSFASSMKLEDIWNFYVEGDVNSWFRKGFNLELSQTDFTLINPPKGQGDKKEKVYEIVDQRIVSRLVALGRLRVVNIDHPNVPGMKWQLIYLTDPAGRYVALTDVKREDGKDFGLSYGFILPPVYNAETKVWEFGIEALERKLTYVIDEEGNHVSGYNSDILNPETKEIVRQFATRPDDFEKPGNAVRIAILQQLITEHCGKYGFPVPMQKTQHGLLPMLGGKIAAESSVTVDFGSLVLTMEERYEILKNCGVPLNVAGSKSNRLDVRKYAIANAKGGAVFSHEDSHISRPGKQLSQISKGLKQMTMRVAIVQSDTLSQAWITPSGIEKQKLETAFLPKVYTSKEDAVAELPEEAIQELKYCTWSGETRIAYVAGIRATIEIGKLIDYNGNKFMPARINQVSDQNGDNVDVLIPWTELAAKGNLNAIIQDKEPEEITIHTRSGYIKVMAIVVKIKMFRSGSGTENICGGKCRIKTKGLDKFAINWAVKRVQEKGFELDWLEWEPNLEYLYSLIKLAKALRK